MPAKNENNLDENHDAGNCPMQNMPLEECGCLPVNEESIKITYECLTTAVPLSQLYESGEMPVVQWDGEVQQWLDHRADIIEDIHIDEPGKLLPWNVFNAQYRNTAAVSNIYFSQGSIGSCCGHAFGFAYVSSLLTSIGLRGGQVFHRINPIGTYVLSHGGRMANGQNVSKMAQFCNKRGNFLADDIGDNNQKVPKYSDLSYENAKKNQSAVMFLPDVNAVLACLRGGIAVAVGNSVKVNGSKIDENGMVIATLGGRWAHATHFAGHIRLGKTDYYHWINSHGKIYKQGKFNETKDGCWMTENLVKQFLGGVWASYGHPVAIFAEGKQE